MNVSSVKYLFKSFWKHWFCCSQRLHRIKSCQHLGVYKNKANTDHEILTWWDLHTQHDPSWSTLELRFSGRNTTILKVNFELSTNLQVVHFWTKCDNWFSIYTWIYTHTHRYTSTQVYTRTLTHMHTCTLTHIHIHTHREREMWSSQPNSCSSFCC